jgi:REP element-mobilizing transposase RayT
VFAVSGRQYLLSKEHKEELHKYITGIVTKQGQKLIAINSMPDHLHILFGLKPDVALSALVRDIKASSSKFINERRLVRGKFSWQEGFGAFSYGHSQLESVIRYIQNQEQHHQRSSFKDEYLALLEKFKIEFDQKYVFDFADEQRAHVAPTGLG